MLKHGTTFVVGAGLSGELGLPMGASLGGKIANLIDRHGKGQQDVLNTLYRNKSAAQVDEIDNAVNRLSSALPAHASIDNLLERLAGFPGLEQCAKVGIVSAILMAESEAGITVGNDTHVIFPTMTSFDIKGIGPSYREMFHLITSGVHVAALGDAFARLCFVTFNYDRMLEGIFHALVRAAYGLTRVAATEVIGKATFLHAYGSVGNISQSEVVPIANPLSKTDLNAAAQRIKTFSESRNSGSDLEIKDVIAKSSQLIFLGCAFHQQNIDLLRPTTSFDQRPIWGTHYKPPPFDKHAKPTMELFAQPDIQALKAKLIRWSKGSINRLDASRIHIEPLTCEQLIAKYGSSWTSDT